ncbi:MAG: hypothetical protein GY801_45935, partial [bacterium]|nr:hypothetical protein [bacterium]
PNSILDGGRRRQQNKSFSSGEFPSGEFPSGEFPSGEFPSGEFPSGEFPSGEFPSGEFSSVEPWSPLKEARNAFEKQYILQCLKAHQGNITKTAQTLGIERTYLHKKIRMYQDE